MTKIEPVGILHVYGCRAGIDALEASLNLTGGEYKLYTEAQMRQIGEACISALDNSGSANGVYYAKKIRELIKEMLG